MEFADESINGEEAAAFLPNIYFPTFTMQRRGERKWWN